MEPGDRDGVRSRSREGGGCESACAAFEIAPISIPNGLRSRRNSPLKKENEMNVAVQTGAYEETIKARAYAIWEDEGRPEGKHLDHWRRAADELAAPEAQNASSNGARPAPRRTAKSKSTR
jgi:hypothetical protein